MSRLMKVDREINLTAATVGWAPRLIGMPFGLHVVGRPAGLPQAFGKLPHRTNAPP
jgi:hypothetical protein